MRNFECFSNNGLSFYYNIENLYIHLKKDNSWVLDRRNILYPHQIITTRNIIKNRFGIKARQNSQNTYLIPFDDHYIQVRTKYLLALINIYFKIRRCKNYIHSEILKFRLQQRDFLLHSIENNIDNPFRSISFFCDFLMIDYFSFWILNSDVGFLLCERNNYEIKEITINRDSNEDLFNFIESDDLYAYSNQIKSDFYALHYKDYQIRTCIRIKVKITNQETALLLLFSQVPDFSIKEKYIMQLIRIMRDSIAWAKQKEIEKILKFETVLIKSNLESKENNSFSTLAKELCNLLSFEAGSILVYEDEGLHFISSFSRYKEYTLPEVIYPNNNKYLSSKVLLENRIIISENISSDSNNSHLFDEPTSLAPRTWIGIPIVYNDQKLGIIRLKNKIKINHESEIYEYSSITSTDLILLQSFAKDIARAISSNKTITQIEENLSESKKIYDRLSKKYTDLENYVDVFLHEFKAPLSSFTLVPDLIISVLEPYKARIPVFEGVRLKLHDIRFLGERFRLITNINNTEDLFKSKEIERIFILQDVIIPVIDSIKRKIKLNSNQKIILRKENLVATSILGDKSLLNIVMNNLVDNAVKYSITGKDIIIEGSINDEKKNLQIKITNYGLPIEENEKDKIFNYNVRGIHASDKKKKITGMGIGLYLAKLIMEELSGKIGILSLKDPVIFYIEIPLYFVDRRS